MKHLPLALVALFLACVQIGGLYWVTHRTPPIAQRLERIHVDITDGVLYANFDSTTVGMTPRAALQMQVELGRTIAEIQNRARQAQQVQ